jgi:holliday junction DNA helicase RuvA
MSRNSLWKRKKLNKIPYFQLKWYTNPMIAYLKGTILEKTTNFLIVENNGIGYKIFVTPEILEKPLNSEVSLYTHLKSSDDGQTLFGLPDFPTLQFFELLITVSGVGPKVALGILSAAKVAVIEQAIANQDAEIFTRMSGVGKKTAERIILELKNKIGALLSVSPAGGSEAYDALISLGYSAKEARETISKLDTGLPMEEQLKQALKQLSK